MGILIDKSLLIPAFYWFWQATSLLVCLVVILVLKKGWSFENQHPPLF